MNKTLTTFFLLILSISISYSQNTETLKDYGIDEYYSIEETTKNIFSNIEITPTPIINSEINNDFSNTDDLNWLSSIAQNNKVLLIGETHYSRFIGNIIGRIFFTINSYDYYPVVFIEQPYSITEFINHFVAIRDDKTANDFFNNELSNFLSSDEEASFYKQIRNWNKKHTGKPLSIGATDLEFNLNRTLNVILKPYLYGLKEIDKNKIDSIINQGLTDDFFTRIAPLTILAENRKLVGNYPFINHQYIKNIIANLKSTKESFDSNFNINRHAAIKRNLTDEAFFGLKLKTSKVMLYGGGYHMKTKSDNKENESALSEGLFLSNEYSPTKGKAYSIMIDGMASYSLDKMSNRSLNECVQQGTQYRKIVNRLKKAYAQKLLDPNKSYFIFYQRNDLEKLIVGLSYKNDNSSIMLHNQDWVKIENVLNELPAEERDAYEQIIKEKNMFDYYIFVPKSPITTAKYK